jgi:hypothetical protein
VQLVQGSTRMTKRASSGEPPRSNLLQNHQLQEQYVLDISTTDCPAEPAICVYESIQGEKVMAPRFLEDLPEASIQTRTEIQEESKAKVGKTEMDESG